MKRGVRMFTACCMAVGMTFTGASTIAFAAKDTSLAGLNTEYSSAQEVQEEATVDTSLNGQTAFAQCDEYINIRSGAGSDNKVVGKIYNNGAATIVAQEGDWYKIKSGNVTGYAMKDYFATGEKAEKIAKAVGYKVATVYSEALTVRSSADQSSSQVGTVYESEQMEVLSYSGDWMKVRTNDGTCGYVNANYVGYETQYQTAETLSEEQARLDREWTAYLAQQEALAAAQAEQEAQMAAYYESVEPVTYSYVDTSATQQSATDAQAAANEAYQVYLDAQAVADASVATTDAQKVYDTAADAQKAYQAYLDAQAIADAQAVGAAAAETTETTQATDTTAATTTTTTTTTYDTSSVDAAWQAYLDAQATADAATQQMDSQLVYDTAAAATAAYEAYLAAVAAADAAGVPTNAETNTTPTTTTDTTTTTTTTTTTYDTSSVDAAWQAYLDAQATADAATQQMDSQLVYDTAAAAAAAYEAYLAAVDAADAAGVPTNAETNTTPTTTTTTTDTTTTTTTTDTTAATTTTETAPAAPAKSKGQEIADYACQFVGNPYVWGGSSLTNGADCSGFTMAVYNKFGVSLPHSAASQSGYGTPVSMSDLQPGDLLFYNGSGGIGHVTMYIGNGQVVHASSSTTGIIISSVDYRTPCSATRLV